MLFNEQVERREEGGQKCNLIYLQCSSPRKLLKHFHPLIITNILSGKLVSIMNIGNNVSSQSLFFLIWHPKWTCDYLLNIIYIQDKTLIF